MNQEFFINQNSELPILAIELIYDGRGDFHKLHEMLQNADITFTMTNVDTRIIKVANAPAYIKEREIDGCVTEYIICYNWKKRDTKEKGTYEGVFTISFGDDLSSEYSEYYSGDLIVPIREKLRITIR